MSSDDDGIGISVFPFAKFKEKLIGFLEISNHDKDYISNKKPQLKYLINYLESIDTQTVVLEHNYIDRVLQADYLAYWTDDSFANQYNRGRFHFFSTKFVVQEVEYAVEQQLHELQKKIKAVTDDYLGYMVVIRGSSRFIASTCLQATKRYNTNTDYVFIPTTREYSVNLLGIKLCVENTLGFMEQDPAVSACATCAAWSAIQKTSVQYKHESLTPGEITSTALGTQGTQNILPDNKGLKPADLQRLFKSINQLNAFVLSADTNDGNSGDALVAARKLYAIIDKVLPLLDYGIPVVLCIKKNGGGNVMHAICLTGYTHARDKSDYEKELEATNSKPTINTKSRKITGLIAHDDNIGPFVKFKIDGKTGELYIKKTTGNYAKWHVDSAICPIHSSIRLYPHKNIQSYIRESPIPQSLKKKPTWSFRLWSSNEYKQIIAAMVGDKYSSYTKKLVNFLSMNLPQYIYIAHVDGGDKFQLHIVFSIAGPWQQRVITIIPFIDNARQVIKQMQYHNSIYR